MAKQRALPQTQRSLIAPHPRTRATGENVDFTVPEIRVGCVVWRVRFQGSFRNATWDEQACRGKREQSFRSGQALDIQDLDATLEIKSRQHRWPKGHGFRARQEASQEAFTPEMTEHTRDGSRANEFFHRQFLETDV